MPSWAYVLIAVVVAAIIVGGAMAAMARKRRSGHLRDTFATEYDRTVEQTGSRRDAERELADREKQREELDIVPLPAATRERYAASWQQTQSEFVDSPRTALRHANDLVEDVMRDRGYPVERFDEQAALVSVDHPDVVENYRAAHDIAVSAERGEASTEDMRRALRHYRSLFEELLGEATTAADANGRPREEAVR